jgi:hypothetical protein
LFAPARWRDEFLASFDAASPALIAVARRDETPWAKGRADDSLAQLRAWREFSARVDRRYAPAGAEGDYLLFLRKEGR